MNLAWIPATQHAQVYASLLRIRITEETLVALYPELEMRCPTHFSIGQEAAATGVCEVLRPDDQVYSTHRCHAHYIAKGGHLGRMVAELYGKATGCCGGKGGSMHLVDMSVGMMGTSAIVGSSIPIAVGAALAFQLAGTDAVAVAFMGDAAPETGAFYESLNFAALRRLPIVFAIENNLYATASPLATRQPLDNLWQHGEPFGVPGVWVDGMDVAAVYHAAQEAVQRARAGEGPSLIESRTYRYLEHVGPYEDYDLGYRSAEEGREWKARDPVPTFRSALLADGRLSAADLQRIEQQVRAEVDAAVTFTRESPLPAPAELERHLFA